MPGLKRDLKFPKEPTGKYSRPIYVPGRPKARAMGGLGLNHRNKGKPNYYMIRDVVEYYGGALSPHIKRGKKSKGAFLDHDELLTKSLDKLVNGKQTF